MVFEVVLSLLNEFGFFRVVLPFLLVFALVYAIVMKSGILGKADQPWTRNIAAILALAIAFIFIAYTPAVEVLAILIPQASFVLVVALMLMMVIALVFPGMFKWIGNEQKISPWLIIPGIAILIIFIAITGYAVGERVPFLYGFAQMFMGSMAIGEDAINMLVAFAVIVVIPIVVIGLILWGGKGGSGKPVAVKE